jgi:hypothetical protein
MSSFLKLHELPAWAVSDATTSPDLSGGSRLQAQIGADGQALRLELETLEGLHLATCCFESAL